MLKNYLCIFLLSICLVVVNFFIEPNSVKIKEYNDIQKELEDKTVTINSINPVDTNFSDLLFLKKSLQDAEIVLLGEQQHGDGATFMAKSRLIKFLHQEMGFDVLIYESGLFDCSCLWDTLKREEIFNPDIFSDALFSFWCQSEETQPLLNYIIEKVNTKNELEINGCDLQFSGKITGSERKEQLINYFNEYKEFDKDKYKNFFESLDGFWKVHYGKINLSKQNELLYEIKDLNSLITKKGTLSRKDSIFDRYLSNIHDYYRYKLKFKGNSLAQINIRDSVMANNIIWLKSNFYRNRKIIIWAANSHIISNPWELEYYDGYRRMGDFIKEKYKNHCYINIIRANHFHIAYWL